MRVTVQYAVTKTISTLQTFVRLAAKSTSGASSVAMLQHVPSVLLPTTKMALRVHFALKRCLDV